MAKIRSESARKKLLRRQTATNRRDLVAVLLKGQREVERRILRAARTRRFATVRRVREGIWKDLSQAYLGLQGDLDKWAKRSVLRTSKEYHALAAEDLLLTEEDKRVISFTKFSDKHIEEYFERVHPFNAERLAAVNVHLNPGLNRMLNTDVRALRKAVIDVVREAEVAAMTPVERYKALQARVMAYADNPDSWAFIDRKGRTWKKNNYFAMLNRTVTANVARDTYHDTLTGEGRDLVKLIGGLSSESREACVKYVENTPVLSITGATEGFPTLGEYEAAGGFGPNCVHTTVYVSEFTDDGQALIERYKKAA